MYLIFEEGKCRGRSTLYSYSNIENEEAVEVSEGELQGIIGDDWQSKLPYLKLVDGEVAFDEEAYEQSLTKAEG